MSEKVVNPYKLFVRILHELYAETGRREIKTPAEITGGEFVDLAYQVDAVRRGIEIIEKYDGVMVADVVGLGKSVIAATIAVNLAMSRTVVIAPPHLKRQWSDYVEEMGLKPVVVASSGNLEKLYRESVNRRKPTLYIIDEAHRYRNEATATYALLHKLMRAHPENKVILLTATPYNNRPQDVYAMLKLFQIPGRASMLGGGNLAVRFQKLIAKYNKLEKVNKRTGGEWAGLKEIAGELREIIEPVMIRRSRIDLMEIGRYAEDLRRQGIEFPKVHDPEVVSYDLGEYEEVYLKTLRKIGGKKWTGAKYKPLCYLKDVDKFAQGVGAMEFNLTQQVNLANLARRLLVLRFESSIEAFESTLEKMIESYRETVQRWNEGRVLISRRMVDEESEGAELLMVRDEDGVVVPRGEFREEFIEDVEGDLRLLEGVREEWAAVKARDPKVAEVERRVRELLEENSGRKVVIFSSFADTAKYVGRELKRMGVRAVVYTGSSGRAVKKVIAENFDASYRLDDQCDDYDVVVTTDALAEGFNLHRAGVIINYDIPYNPTRVIQRLGRINRVNRKMFDELYIYNFFPTVFGEEIVKVRGIAKLKMLLINSVVGSDTKTLTADESLESYFAERYVEASAAEEERSWDNNYRNIYNECVRKGEVEEILVEEWPEQFAIENGVGMSRENGFLEGCAFVERGEMKMFVVTDGTREGTRVVPMEEGLRRFELGLSRENGFLGSASGRLEGINLRLELVREELVRPYELLKMTGCRGDMMEVLEVLKEACVGNDEMGGYLRDLEAMVRETDDLSEWGLKRIGGYRKNMYNIEEILATMNEELPGWFVKNSCVKAGKIGVGEELKIWMMIG